jgi:GTP cyclohydrolase I
VAEAFGVELTQGYAQDPVQILRDNLIARVDTTPAADVVMIRDVVVTTVCPHHLMPAQGKASVAFRPHGALVGIGALGQVVDACSRRLALQEDIGQAVALAVKQALDPAWVACHMVLSHSCMNARGDRRHGASVETVATLGDVDPLMARALFVRSEP